MEKKELIESGMAVLGIELGSTRIKAVLIDDEHKPIAQGFHNWENRFENGIWTYNDQDIITGIQDCYKSLADDVLSKYGVKITKLSSIGISAMMHGYLPFNEKDELLVPFRTWRNTITDEASKELTALFNYNIPQRWSIAHFYQAILRNEEHTKEVSFLTTLAGYIHWKLTGEKVLGIGDASGMFPIDSKINNYDEEMAEKFNSLIASKGYKKKLNDILPKVLLAGEKAGILTEDGAKLLDITGTLQKGAVLCPPEGDAGTGMVATNSVKKRTGNISAGTSIFAMVVLEDKLSKVYPEIDMVTTPSGSQVAMVHCNNCSSDIDAWINVLKEYTKALGVEVDTSKLYETFYKEAQEGDLDCGGLLSYNYLSGEHITGVFDGRPMLIRTPESDFSFKNFARVNLYSALGTIRVGLDILINNEKVKIDDMFGHGGFYKTTNAGQRITSAAIKAPVCVMETAGEGGAWGIACLAAYAINKEAGNSLESYLDNQVFAKSRCERLVATEDEIEGFDRFMEKFKAGLELERSASKYIK